MVADERLKLLAIERPDLNVRHQLVETFEQADDIGFFGSPSIHVAGVDLFAEPGSQAGLSCRRYPTPNGYEGAPTLEQLRAALTNG